MAKYHPIGTPIKAHSIINLSNREIDLIRMVRKVEADEYHTLVRRMWSHYINEMEKFDIDTSFISSNDYKKPEQF